MCGSPVFLNGMVPVAIHIIYTSIYMVYSYYCCSSDIRVYIYIYLVPKGIYGPLNTTPRLLADSWLLNGLLTLLLSSFLLFSTSNPFGESCYNCEYTTLSNKTWYKSGVQTKYVILKTTNSWTISIPNNVNYD
jgi:hypothetical protein